MAPPTEPDPTYRGMMSADLDVEINVRGTLWLLASVLAIVISIAARVAK